MQEALVAARIAAERLGAPALVEMAYAYSILRIGCECQVICIRLAEQALRDVRPTFFSAIPGNSTVLFQSPGEVDEGGAVELEERAKEEVGLSFR